MAKVLICSQCNTEFWGDLNFNSICSCGYNLVQDIVYPKNEKKSEALQKKVVDLYWEYDRMSSSGKESLDDIARLLGVPTEEEVKTMLENNND